MPNPKRKISKTRRDKRRTHYKTTAPTVNLCSQCGEMKLSHRVCPACGTYNGRQILAPAEVG